MSSYSTLRTLKHSTVIGYYPYEGVNQTDRICEIESNPCPSFAFTSFKEWWNETVNIIDTKLSGSATPVYGRAHDNKVTLKMKSENGNEYYITFYDFKIIIHLDVSIRNKESGILIPVIW